MARESQWDKDLRQAAERIRSYGADKADKVRIYTTCSHVSRSGMMRHISAFVMVDNAPVCIARGVRVSGCGMDMGFHLAYCIYCTLFPYNTPEGKAKPYQEYLQHQWF
jgi:hypothetical protein